MTPPGHAGAVEGAVDVVHVVEASTAGVRRHVFDVIEGLLALRVRQTLVYSPVRADARFLHGITRFAARGVACIELPMERPVRLHRDLWAALQLSQVLRGLRPAIVHLHSSKAGGVGRLAALTVTGLSVVYTPNASAIHLSRVYLWIERLLGHLRTDALIAVSQSEYDELAAARLVWGGHLFEVDSGVDAGEVLEEAAAPVVQLDAPGGLVVSSGRLTEQKDPLTLVEASALVARARPEVRFVWVGDGVLRPAMEALARDRGVADRWTITGWVENPLSWLTRADVFALPSIYESFGYVTLEAMILGRPVVATAVTGSVDLVHHGVSGLLVPPKDPAAFAAALLRLLQDPVFARACGNAGRSRAEHFTRERMALGIFGVYRRCAPRAFRT